MKKITFLCLLIISLVITACGALQSEAPAGSGMKTVVDANGNKVVIPAKPKRIVSLTLGTDELLLDMVEPERIIAVTSLADDVGISHVVEKSKKIKNKIQGVPSAEQILALKPDLVIIADWWSLNILDSLREMNIPVYVYKTPYNVEAIKVSVEEVAGVVGEEKTGKALIAEMEKDLEKVRIYLANHKNESSKQILVLSTHGIIGGRGSLFADMCRLTHIKNCLQDIPVGQATTLSKEMILQANPDMILLTSWSAPGMKDVIELKEMLEDASLQTVTAIKKQEVIPVAGNMVDCVSHYVTKEIYSLAEAVYHK